MEYSDDQIRGFREEFARKHRIRILVTALVFLCACLLVGLTTLIQSKDTDVLIISIFGMLLLIGVFYLMQTSRCPACGRLVGRPMRARFCDQCGVSLRGD